MEPVDRLPVEWIILLQYCTIPTILWTKLNFAGSIKSLIIFLKRITHLYMRDAYSSCFVWQYVLWLTRHRRIVSRVRERAFGNISIGSPFAPRICSTLDYIRFLILLYILLLKGWTSYKFTYRSEFDKPKLNIAAILYCWYLASF